MAAEIKRIRLEPDTDLLAVLEDVRADGTPRLIERDGEPLALIVRPDDPRSGADVPKSVRFRERILAMSGVWRDLDADRMIEEIYRARDESPPSDPVDLDQ